MEPEELYWTQRYEDQQTGWDVGYPTPPITDYLDQLPDKSISILFPGAGNGYEVEYAYRQGFRNVHMLDISEYPLQAFQKRVPEFPSNQLIHDDFFEHQGTYDLIIEQTFFCSLIPTLENRIHYAQQMRLLLKTGGKVVGVLFDIPLLPSSNRPFGGDAVLYQQIFNQVFDEVYIRPCYNSIQERKGIELFMILK